MNKKIYIGIFLFLISSHFVAQQVIDKVIAVVGDKAIFKSEVDEQKLQAKQQNVELPPNADCFILEDLLFQKLLLHQAEVDSIEVTEDQVNAELDQRIQYFASQMPGGVSDLEKFYGKSIEEIKDEFYIQIENRMKTQQMQQKVTADVEVSPKEVRDFFNSFPEDSIPLVNSKISVAQIVIKPKVTYEEKQAIKSKLNDIRNRIISGELTFPIAAEFYSQDPGSKQQGGFFGKVTRGDFVPEFDAVAFRIPIGEVSEVFESPFGFHILVIEERRGEQYSGRHILLQSKVGDQQLMDAKLKLDSIRTELNAGRLNWIDAVKEFSDDNNTKGSNGIIYNQSSGSMYWDMQEIDPQLFQAIDQLKPGDISKPMLYETMDGASYRIVKLLESTEPHKANLKDDYQMIQSFALADKKEKATIIWVNSKIRGVYIKFDEAYKTCVFLYDWLEIP